MIAAIAACLIASPPGLYYTVQVIGPSSGANSIIVSAMNDHGAVVGYTNIGPGAVRDFVWEAGRFRYLPGMSATDINNRGDIVGSTRVGGVRHGVVLTAEGERMTFRKEGRQDIAARVINENRWVTGWVDYPGRGIAPFVWKGGGEVIDIGYTSGPPTNQSEGLEINESNVIVGYERGPDYPFYGWVWTERDGLRRVFSVHFSYMNHVNDLGQWLTASWRPRTTRGSGWGVYDRIDGEPIRSYPGFQTFKVNNREEILAVKNDDNGNYWLLTPTDSFRIKDRVVPSGIWAYGGGTDINNRGQILGSAQHVPTGRRYRVLLTPVGARPSP